MINTVLARSFLVLALAFSFVSASHAVETVSQSSTAYGGVASRAYDQNTDGVYRNGSVTHTLREVEPWWMIDLGETRDIESLVIYNRTNCCTARLSDFYVFSSNDPFAYDDVQSTLDDAGVHNEFFAGAADPVNTITINQNARYIRIQLTGSNAPLSLAEVQIIESGSIKIEQSSTSHGGVASRAYDQNTNGVYNAGSVTHTNNELQPWWSIDLGEQLDIDSVVVYNRTNCCTARLSNYYVFTSNQPFDYEELQSTLDDPDVNHEYFAGAADPVNTIWINQTARYLRIQLSGTAPLSLAEVQIVEGTILEVPESVVLLTPLPSDTVFDGEMVDFSWSSSDLATQYEFELYDSEIQTSTLINSTDVLASDCSELTCTLSLQLFNAELSGSYTWRLNAVNEAGNSEWASSNFTVLPLIAATPMPISPVSGVVIDEGATVTFEWSEEPLVTHYDFSFYNSVSDSQINYATGLLPADVCKEAVCSQTIDVSLPIAQEHAWQVMATNVGGSSSWSHASFDVVVSITEPPSSVVLGDPLAGSSIDFNSDVTFSWNPTLLTDSYEFEIINTTDSDANVNEVVFASACTDASCSLVATAALPAGYSYEWRVRATNVVGSSDWAESSFYIIEPATAEPEKPVPISPVGTDLIVGSVASFTWVQDPQIETYDFFLFNSRPDSEDVNQDMPKGVRARQNDLRPQDLCDGTVCVLTTEVDLPVYERQVWRVRGHNNLGTSGWSQAYFNVVELVTDAPTAPAVLTPQANTRLEINTNSTFTWVPSDTATSYEFQILESATADSELLAAALASSACGVSSCSVSIDLSLPISTDYVWQVRAINAAGFSEWTTAPFGTIKQATQQPSMIENISPVAQLQISYADTVLFTWAHDPDAVSYEFHFYDGIEGAVSNLIEDIQAEYACDTQQCSLTQLVELPVAASHAWRVRGLNSLGYSPSWSRTTIEVIPTITDVPGPYELTAPLDGTEFYEGSAVTFTWNRALDATEYEFALFNGDNLSDELEVASLINANCGTDFCSYTTMSPLPVAALYTGKVRAINTIGSTDWSTASFSIAAIPVVLPDTPLAIAPLSGTSVFTDQSVDFQWSADELAVTYDFYLTDSNGDELLIVENLDPAEGCLDGVCTYATVPLLPIGALNTWHVRAVHETESSEWSETLFATISSTDGYTPTAMISVPGFDSDVAGVAPLTLWFDPSGSVDDSQIVSFLWSFGDTSSDVLSESSSGVEHVFTEPGVYAVQLTVTDDSGLTGNVIKSVTVYDPTVTPSDVAASRFLTQATFGATRASIVDVQSQGFESWLDNQFTLQGPAHLDYVSINSNGSNRSARHEVWWSDVVLGEDQLRQRVAFALSQIFVVADTGYTLSNAQYGVTNYYDILRENAFGNYRELLEEVTLSPVMGLYLSMLQNAKSDEALSTRADENYAREVLQLFSIGLHELNADGTTTGSPVFTQDIVEAFARSFTGWNFADASRWDQSFTSADLISPMLPFQTYHDTEPKTLLNGETTPANLGARADLEMALDNIFNHANVGPFISQQLIKRLVTSNPTPAYVERIATVFNDDGYGERGNLQAVVRAILLDDEARSEVVSSYYGKLREPVLRLSHLWRAFNIQPGSQSSERNEFNTVSPQLENLESTTGQAVLKSPSVFNFFQTNHSPAGPVADQGLVAPEFELFTEGNELATSNRIGRQIQNAYAGNPDSAGQTTSYLDFTYERWLANDPDELLNHLDSILMSGNLSTDFRAILLDHINELPDDEEGLSQRVRDAITLIMASPDYLVQM